jgi:hypothetical protein
MQPDGRGLVRVNGLTHAIFEVAESFIGMEGRGTRVEIRTGMGGGDCGFPFQRAKSYVVYAFEDKNGLLVASICSRTAPVEQAQADLAYLRGLPSSEQFGKVYGLAANGESTQNTYQFDKTFGIWMPSGISGAIVTLTGPATNRRLEASDDGSFRFDHLSPGKYNVAIVKDGYSLHEKSAALDVHAGGCAFALGILVIDRRIIGKVTGAIGSAAANILVDLVPKRPTGPNELPLPVARVTTNKDGAYEFRNLRPGEYYLGINLAYSPSKHMPYSRYFYPGMEDPSRAALVIVGPGPGTAAYNFPIPAPKTLRPVEGFVYWPNGWPAESVRIRLEDVRLPWQSNVASTTTDSRGHFEISAFSGTTYRVHAVSRVQSTSDYVSAEPIALGPETDLSKPLQVILSRKGDSTAGLTGKELERWRAGLGF